MAFSRQDGFSPAKVLCNQTKGSKVEHTRTLLRCGGKYRDARTLCSETVKRRILNCLDTRILTRPHLLRNSSHFSKSPVTLGLTCDRENDIRQGGSSVRTT